MHTVTRVVENKAEPRGGFAVKSYGRIVEVCYDDEFSGPEASRIAADACVGALRHRERCEAYWDTLSPFVRRQWRSLYNHSPRFEKYPTVAHCAYGEQRTYALNRHRRGWGLVTLVHDPDDGLSVTVFDEDQGDTYPAGRIELFHIITVPVKAREALGIAYF